MERFRRLGTHAGAHKNGAWCLAPCPKSQSGSFVSGGADGFVRLWSFRQQLGSNDEPADDAEVDPADKSSADDSPSSPVSLVSSWKYHTLGVVGIAVASEGTRGVSSSLDGSLRIWDLSKSDVEAQSVSGLSGNIAEVWAVEISADGSRIVTAGAAGAFSVIDADSALCENSFKYDPDASGGDGPMCLALALSSDSSRVAIGTQDGSVRVFDTETGSPVTPRLAGHSGPVRSLKYLPSDPSAIVTCADDGLVNFYDLDSAQIAISLRGHKGIVLSVCPSPCGKYVASGSADRKLKIWDRMAREQIFTSADHKDSIWDVMYTPDGARIVTASDDEAIAVLDSAQADKVTT